MAGDKIDLTDEEKAGLSDEELEALESDDDDTASLEEIAGEGAGDDDDPDFGADVGDGKPKERAEAAAGEGDDKGTGDGEDAGDAGKKGGDDAGAEAGAEAAAAAEAAKKAEAEGKPPGKEAAAEAGEGTETDADSDREFVATLPVEDVTEAKTRLEAIKTEKETLQAKYKEGDLTLEDMLGQRDKLDSEAGDLRFRIHQSEAAAKHNESIAAQRWQFAQETFFEEHEEYTKNPVLWGALNEQVKVLAAKKENAHRSGSWFMREAHKEVQKLLKGGASGEGDGAGKGEGEGDGKPAGEGGKPAKEAGGGNGKTPGKQPKKPDLSKVPQTLATMPPAAESEAGGESEFAYLDKLTGMEYEMAIAKLTPEQESRYLRSR